jgi:photosystem II stability/assembly factor-like uncharacterized protein
MKGFAAVAILVAASPVVNWAAAASPRAQAYDWHPVKIVAGGYVPGIVFHPAQKGLLYARTDMGGAYRYDSDQHRWTAMTDWIGMDETNKFGIESIAIDPHDVSKVYLAAGMYSRAWDPNGCILRSSDQGRSFTEAALPIKLGGNEDGRLSGERLQVDPRNSQVLYFGSRHDGLWRSEDGAATWHKVQSFPSYEDNGIGAIVELFPPAGSTVRSPGGVQLSAGIYAGVSAKDGGIFYSADGGESWQRVAGQPEGLLLLNAALAVDGKLYAVYGDNPGPTGLTKGAVWQLDTATGQWSDIIPVKPGGDAKFGYGGVAVSALHPETIVVSTLNRWWPSDSIYRSTDRGQHWTEIADSREPRSMSLSPWLRKPAEVPLGTGPWPTALAIDPFDSNHVLFGTGETIWETFDANGLEQGRFVHWKVGADGIEETVAYGLLSPPVGPHLFSALGDIGGFRHDDFTVSPAGGWTPNPRFSNTTSIAYAAQDPQKMVRVGATWVGKIYGSYSLDQGLNWKPFPSQPSGTQGSGTVAISADAKTILWSSEAAPLAYSRDWGASWTNSTLPANYKLTQVAADPVDAHTFYLYAGEEGEVLISTDDGASFREYAAGLPKANQWQHAKLIAAPERKADLWIGSDLGLFESRGAGQPFTPVAAIEKVFALGFGKPADGAQYPAIYLSGRVGGASDVYRSDDAGSTWIRIDDDAHRFGWVGSITGDPCIYGRVYLGTGGRGIIYGDPVGP